MKYCPILYKSLWYLYPNSSETLMVPLECYVGPRGLKTKLQVSVISLENF